MKFKSGVVLGKVSRPWLWIVRGLPGSGKSTYADKESYGTEAIVLETDMYMRRNPENEYRWNEEDMQRARYWCLHTTQIMLNQYRPVFVTGVFSKYIHAKQYIRFAKQTGCSLCIVTMENDFGSIHNVDEDHLAAMKANMEDHDTFMEKVIAYQPA